MGLCFTHVNIIYNFWIPPLERKFILRTIEICTLCIPLSTVISPSVLSKLTLFVLLNVRYNMENIKFKISKLFLIQKLTENMIIGRNMFKPVVEARPEPFL